MLYKDMSNILKPKKIGDFKIDKFCITRDNIAAVFRGISPGNYVRLMYKGNVIMSNTPMEKRTNESFILKSHGDILIAGLGIGLIILPIQDKENVESITVIEKNKEVIDLIVPQLPLNKKVNIINDDIFTWKPENKSKYDMIYFDIWEYINLEILKNQMVPLKIEFQKYLKDQKENPETFIGCWAECELSHNIELQ